MILASFLKLLWTSIFIHILISLFINLIRYCKCTASILADWNCNIQAIIIIDVYAFVFGQLLQQYHIGRFFPFCTNDWYLRLPQKKKRREIYLAGQWNLKIDRVIFVTSRTGCIWMLYWCWIKKGKQTLARAIWKGLLTLRKLQLGELHPTQERKWKTKTKPKCKWLPTATCSFHWNAYWHLKEKIINEFYQPFYSVKQIYVI